MQKNPKNQLILLIPFGEAIISRSISRLEVSLALDGYRMVSSLVSSNRSGWRQFGFAVAVVGGESRSRQANGWLSDFNRVRVVDERAGAGAGGAEPGAATATATSATERRGSKHVQGARARRLHADLAFEKLPGEPYTNMNKPTRASSPGENRAWRLPPETKVRGR